MKFLAALLSPVLALCMFHSCQPKKPQDHIPCQTQQALRLGLKSEPSHLDPRLARSIEEITICGFLYEGLMRIGPNGSPQLASAQELHVSPDAKTYTFFLRPQVWSNGDPVTAYDFAQTLYQVLSPEFPAESADLLFPIKNASLCKKGVLPLSELGVKALDASTLQIQLQEPAPYFLELLTRPIAFAVNRHIREIPLNEAGTHRKRPIVNGPFSLQNWRDNNEMHLKKNGLFWDVENVALQSVSLIILPDERTELFLFEQKELDWAGSPLSTLSVEVLQNWQAAEELHIQPIAGTYWFRLNTHSFPLDNAKLRRALALALNRQEIVDYVTLGKQQPALAVIPQSMWGDGQGNESFYRDGDTEAARQLLMDALKEMDIPREKLPLIALSYSSSERNKKIAQAVQQQWRETLGIQVELAASDAKVFLQNLRSQNYSIAAGSWLADYNDPSNFLQVFHNAAAPCNNTGWENSQYTQMLTSCSATSDYKKRYETLRAAEKFLMQEMPVIPLFHFTYCYVKTPRLKNAFITPTCTLEIRWASFTEDGIQ